MSTYYKEAKIEGDYLVTPEEKVLMLSQSDMAQLPWKELGIDVVVEATGVFRKRSQLEAHLQAGAKRVILTVPSKDEIDATIVIGVNEDSLKPEHKIVSNAS
jgi:glyceraldehyde 3-phosphate dehydrogenase